MSSWLGGGFSSLSGQLSNLTKDILSESTEEVIDHETQLKVSDAKVTELKSYCTSQKLEIERLSSIIRDLEEKTESSELQINRISSEYRSIIKDKENEIKLLKQKQHELLQQQAKSLKQSLEHKDTEAPHSLSYPHPGYGRSTFQGDGVDFGDNIGLQHELNRLSQENQLLQSECEHWKDIADQKSEKSENNGGESKNSNIVQLQCQVKELQKKFTAEKEAHQHEVASLQDLHMEKISTLKKKQKREIDDYMETIRDMEYNMEDLQQRLSKTQDWDSGDWEDWNEKGNRPCEGDSTSIKKEYKELEVSYKKVKDELNSVTKEHNHLQESFMRVNDEINTLRQEYKHLKEQLASMKQENEKFEVNNLRQQDLLNENEDEINVLKMEIDKLQEKGTGVQKEALVDINELKAIIRKKDAEISAVTTEKNKVSDELYNTKQKLLDQMDANHADALDILSDVRGVKRQMDENSLDRKYKLIDKKKFIVDHLLLTGQKQRELDEHIEKAKQADEVVSAETVSVLSSMGDMDHQRLTGEIVDTIEQENTVLKEHNLHLQEQVTLLQKTVSTLTDGRQDSVENVRRLQEKISELKGDSAEISSEKYSDLNISTEEGSSITSNISDLSKANEELHQQVKSLTEQVEKYHDEMEEFELIKSDWEMEKESLEEVLVKLRDRLKEKENIITTIEKEKDEITAQMSSLHDKNVELETSLTVLSTSKDSSSEEQQNETFHEANEHEKQLKLEVENLKARTNEQEEVIKKNEMEKMNLVELKKQRDQQTEVISDLQVKIKNGGLALNELHMDKQELEKSLKKYKEEMQSKSCEFVEYKKQSIERYQVLEMELDDSKKEIEELKELLNAATRKPRSLTPDISEGQREFSNLREMNYKLQCDNDLLQKKMSNIESDKVFVEESLEESEKKYELFKDQLEEKAHKKHEELIKQVELVKSEKESLEKSLFEKEQKLEDLQSIYHSKTEDLQQALDLNVRKLEDEVQNTSKLKLDNSKMINDLKSEIESLSSDLNETKEVLNTTLSNHKEISDLLQEKEMEISDLKREQLSLIDQRDELTVQVSDLQVSMCNIRDLDKRSSSFDEQNQSIKSELEQLEIDQEPLEEGKAQDTECSDGKTLDIITDLESELNSANNTISVLRNELNKYENSVGDKDNSISELNSVIKGYEKMIDEFKNKIEKQELCFVELNRKISMRDEELKSASAALSSQSADFDTCRTLLNEKEKAVAALNVSVMSHEKTSNERQNEMKKLQSMIDELQQRLLIQAQNETLVLNKIKSFQSEILNINSYKAVAPLHHALQAESFSSQSFVGSNGHREEVREQTSSNLHKGSCFIDIEAIPVPKNFSELDDVFTSLKQQYCIKDQHIVTLIDKFKQILPLVDEKQRHHLPNIFNEEFKNQFFEEGFMSDLLEKDSTENLEKAAIKTSAGQSESTSSNGNIVNELINKVDVRPVSCDRLSDMSHDTEYDDKWDDRTVDIAEQLERLQSVIHEKDNVIADLQQTNSSLLKLIDKPKASNLMAEKHLVDKDKLENEIRSLKNEKEQILAVMNEKSRECSNYKTEVNRLMSIVSAQKAALDKALQDNNYLVQSSEKKPDENKQTSDRHLSNLVRDKDLEIESLKQKNETLLAVIQESSPQSDGNKINMLLKEKDSLLKTIQTLESDREQILQCVNQKHQENVAFYNEIQRLTSGFTTEKDAHQRLQDDHSNLITKFEEQKQVFVEIQNELIQCKMRFTELEMKYGELLQKSGAKETVNVVEYNSKVDQVNSLKEKLTKMGATLSEKEDSYQSLFHKTSELENSFTKIELERNLLKKQYENVKSQLQGLQSELSDLEVDNKSSEQKTSEQIAETNEVKLLNDQLMLAVKEKEVEIGSWKEMVNTLNAVIQEKQGEQSQLQHMMQENESVHRQLLTVQHALDSAVLQQKQTEMEKQDFIHEIGKLKEKETKQKKELDRLRAHLLEIEDGYTREALVAEEREKNLRDRLTAAEEKLYSSSTAVEYASQQAGMQVESLQQQLHIVISQRDEAYLQLAQLQEQCQQQSVSIANLQLVLEQFQQEKDTLVSMETEKYERENKALNGQLATLKKSLNDMALKVHDAEDGLEAAARLSEQLDKKGEEIVFLRREVQQKEQILKEAKEEIRKLTSGTEAKVDKIIIKNLLLGYFHTPQNKRNEVIRLLGSVLGFEQEDFMQIYGDTKLSWVPGFLRFGQQPSSQSFVRRSPIDHTFSELFVKFLEKESTPRPVPAILPAEEMARDVEKKYKDHKDPTKSAYNPFTAPRHVAMPITVGGRSSPHDSHPLMAPLSPPSLPMLSPFSLSDDTDSSGSLSRSQTPPTSTSILKDVLGSK